LDRKKGWTNRHAIHRGEEEYELWEGPLTWEKRKQEPSEGSNRIEKTLCQKKGPNYRAGQISFDEKGGFDRRSAPKGKVKTIQNYPWRGKGLA